MRMSSYRLIATLLIVGGAPTGCVAKGGGNTNFGSEDIQGSGGSAGAAGASGGSGISLGLAGSTAYITVDPEASAGDPDANHMPGIYKLPEGYTPGIKGGYKLGEPLGATLPPETMDAGSVGGCGGTIRGITRDFKRGDKAGGHPDFEKFMGDGEKGIVAPQLGADLKPVYVDTKHLLQTNKANFDQWYRNVDGVNKPYLVYLVVEPNGTVFSFDSDEFFPLDGQGWGNEGHDHNFAFTTEVHTKFKYNGGETFTFKGDDDVWVFINNKLAIDLGGLHQVQTLTVALDTEAATLGITKDQVYQLDLFHAERHSVASNFRIDTNLEFVDCGIIVDIAR